jgi:hypothetical protein
MQQYTLEGDNPQIMKDLEQIYREGRNTLAVTAIGKEGPHRKHVKDIHVFLKAFVNDNEPLRELTVASSDLTVRDVMTVDHEGPYDEMVHQWWFGGKSAVASVLAHTNEIVWKEMKERIEKDPDMSQEDMQSALMSCLSKAGTASQADSAT